MPPSALPPPPAAGPTPRARPRRRPAAASVLAWAALGVLGGLPARAAAEISAELHPEAVEVGAPCQLEVRLRGRRVGSPVLPPLPDFALQRRGESHHVSFVNGAMRKETTYSFVLVPQRAGRLSVPPITAEVDGKVVSSPEQVLVVTQPAAPAAGAAAGPTGAAAAPAAAPGDAQAPLLLEVEVSNLRPYVGERILYTWRFLHRVRVVNASVTLPPFSEFFAEPVGAKHEELTVVRGPHTYRVSQVRMALVPQRPGPLRLEGSALQCEVEQPEGRSRLGHLFAQVSVEPASLRSPPLHLEVRPLPEPRPADFVEVVGEVELGVELRPHRLALGDSAHLQVTLRGHGQLAHLGELPWQAPAGLRAYNDRPTLTLMGQANPGASAHEALGVQKVFKKALVPSRPGHFVLPPVRLSTFNPASGAYQFWEAPLPTLEVTGEAPAAPPAVAAPTPAAPAQIEILGEDIHHQATDPAILKPRRFGPRAARAHLLAAVLPPLGALGLGLAGRWWAQRAGPEQARRRRQRGARARALAEVPKISAAIAAGRLGDAAERASRALRGYLGDQLGREGLSLTPAEVGPELGARGVAAPLVKRCVQLLERCEMGQYQSAPGTVSMYHDLGPRVGALVADLERALGGGGWR